MLLYNNCWISLLLIMLVAGCKEELAGPQLNDGVAPGGISVVEVENMSGAARIVYTLPQDPDLLYVIAEYQIRPGITRDVKSSFYNNNLTVDGFGESKEYEVKLYAVDKGENRSQPVTVKVNPGISPIQLAKASLQIKEDFGGINLRFKNPAQGDIIITTLMLDSLNKYQPLHKKYTKDSTGVYSLRGLASRVTRFGAFISDRWDNITDTFFIDLTPIFEIQVPFKDVKLFAGGLPGDYVTPRAPWKWEYIFDGDLLHVGNRFIVTPVGSGVPQSFTIDLGGLYKLSRYKYYQRTDNAYFKQGPKDWELYGSADPNPNGEYDASWTLLHIGKHRQPSGDGGEILDSDIQSVIDGMEFDLPLDAPPVRYIRWKSLHFWENTNYTVMGDVMFWGSPQ